MADGNDDTPTCGKGLAQHSAVIDRLATYVAENADVLESHLSMLDQSDPLSHDEGVVYTNLVTELRQASSALRASATRMSKARDLPMGRHVDSIDANAVMAEAFRRFVDSESALVDEVSARLADDRQMLSEMA